MTAAGSELQGAAAVLLVLAGSGDEERILLTQRAAHLTLHAGEVAFPGGKWEPGDRDLQQTALRETHEEVGLDPASVEILGQLATAYTGRGIAVSPFVGRIAEADIELRANPDELESLFWMPTQFLLEDQRQRTDVFEFAGHQQWAPVYSYLGYTIWGFTARVLVDYANRFWSAGIGRDHHAPGRIYTRF
jgi:8-oxo-dGTP pyrophosphatase MutT (NUDIX family)